MHKQITRIKYHSAFSIKIAVHTNLEGKKMVPLRADGNCMSKDRRAAYSNHCSFSLTKSELHFFNSAFLFCKNRMKIHAYHCIIFMILHEDKNNLNI